MKSKNVSLKGIEKVNDKDVYAVKLDKTTYFYEVATGLKLAESAEIEQMGQKFTSTTNYNDYKDVKGVKFAHNVIMNIGIELNIKLTDIKINEGVTDEDFK